MADYRVEDLLMIERWRMWSAMAFIKSGGTLFPTRPPAVANFPDCGFWPTDSFASARQSAL